MAQQKPLTFGNLTVCDPSNGWDGYVMTRNNPAKTETIEVSIPGTSGRIKIIKGKSTNEQSSWKMTFRCLRLFASDAALNNFLNDVEVATTDNSSQSLRTVNYGFMDGSNTFSKTQCEMDFEPNELWKSTDGFWLDFIVTFTRWGTD